MQATQADLERQLALVRLRARARRARAHRDLTVRAQPVRLARPVQVGRAELDMRALAARLSTIKTMQA
jgi:hypothetical protein